MREWKDLGGSGVEEGGSERPVLGAEPFSVSQVRCRLRKDIDGMHSYKLAADSRPPSWPVVNDSHKEGRGISLLPPYWSIGPQALDQWRRECVRPPASAAP
ncbi:hypothetical protein O3P69_004149 [Scylla paramamosain]|uniref:Uncharacterized protein n=1 Tax=Scylla paramamosain TaxID=85552 RepID=A0AAW0UGC0_SCYPA